MAKRILVIEDDPDYQELHQTVFSALYEVIVVDSAEAGISKLDTEHFNLVIADINLFGMTGLEILRKINSAGLTQEIPVVICTGQSDPFTKEQAIELGAAGFVTKPFAVEAMLSFVGALLK
ncbi:MAG TPA: hypothetical protein DCL44_01430 [Elusimicrobia bacterium]|nr:hypothetical protein [Elusimicrobiota bacterium]